MQCKMQIQIWLCYLVYQRYYIFSSTKKLFKTALINATIICDDLQIFQTFYGYNLQESHKQHESISSMWKRGPKCTIICHWEVFWLTVTQWQI